MISWLYYSGCEMQKAVTMAGGTESGSLSGCQEAESKA